MLFAGKKHAGYSGPWCAELAPLLPVGHGVGPFLVDFGTTQIHSKIDGDPASIYYSAKKIFIYKKDQVRL